MMRTRNGSGRLRQAARRGLRQAERAFHLAIAAIFLVLAAVGASLSVSEWRFYEQAPQVGWLRLALFGSFTLLLVGFSLYSYLKARSVR